MITEKSKGLDFSRRKLNPNKMLKRDLWWDAEKCLKLGLVDKIVCKIEYT